MSNLRSAARYGVRVLLCGTVLATAGQGVPAQTQRSAVPLPLKVVGTQLRNSQNRPVLLRGVSPASLEWPSDGGGHIPDPVRRGIRDWLVTVIRLPLAQDRWFGKAPEQTD